MFSLITSIPSGILVVYLRIAHAKESNTQTWVQLAFELYTTRNISVLSNYKEETINSNDINK